MFLGMLKSLITGSIRQINFSEMFQIVYKILLFDE